MIKRVNSHKMTFFKFFSLEGKSWLKIEDCNQANTVKSLLLFFNNIIGIK